MPVIDGGVEEIDAALAGGDEGVGVGLVGGIVGAPRYVPMPRLETWKVEDRRDRSPRRGMPGIVPTYRSVPSAVACMFLRLH
jgi:hypothetical protein